jgi:uncharacterized coiled-coil DUF342 family protein
MSSPIPFIQPDEKGNFHVDKRAAAILNKIRTPVTVVCVAGPYRTGKSYLLNRLIYNENDPVQDASKGIGFSVGNTVNACTKGIWLWSEPYYNDVTKTTYIFLDTEGLNSTGEEVTFDTQIFSLSVLLSSIFILNTQNSITESELEQLELVAECSKKISFSKNSPQHDYNDDDNNNNNNNNNNTSSNTHHNDEVDTQLALHFPRLLWVLRDFTLGLVDKEDNPITPTQYLEGVLKPLPQTGKRGVEHKNQIRKSIRDCFIKRECLPLPRPVNDEELLRKLQLLPPERLRPEFQEGIRQLKMRSLQLYGHFKKPIQQHNQNIDLVKYIDNKPVTGDVLLGLAHIYCDAINTGGIPTILSAWQSVLENKKLSVIQDLVQKMESYLWNLVQPTIANKKGELSEPEYDEIILRQKYETKLDYFIQKVLHIEFPGDFENINTVANTLGHKTAPILEKVIEFSQMKATEYNKTLFTKIMQSIHPEHKIPYHNVFPLLCSYDIQKGEKPINNSNNIISTISSIISTFRTKAKGSNKTLVENDLLTELSNQIIGHLSSTIVSTATAFVETLQKVEHLKTKLTTARNDIVMYKDQADRYSQQVHEYSTKLTQLRDEKGQIQANLNTIQHKYELLEEQLKTIKNEKRTLTTTLENTKRELEQTISNNQIGQLELVKLQGEKKAAEVKRDEVDKKASQFEHEFKKSSELLHELQQLYKQKENDITKLEVKIQNGTDKLLSKNQLVTTLENEINGLKHQLQNMENEKNKQYDSFEKERFKFNKHGDANSQRIIDLESTIKKNEKKLVEFVNAAHTAEETIHELEQEQTSLNKQIKNFQTDIKTYQNDIRDVNNQLQTAQNNKIRDEQKIQDLTTEIVMLQDLVQTLETKQRRSSFNQQQQQQQQPTGKRKSSYELDKSIKKQRHSMDDYYDDDGDADGDADGDDDDADDDYNVQFVGQDDDDDHDDDDSALEAISRKEQKRRSTVHAFESQNDSGWSSPWNASPAKIPDQAKLIERRKRDGSIFPDGDDTKSNRNSIINPQTNKRTHSRLIDPAFKKAAKESFQIDDEVEYQKLKKTTATKNVKKTPDIPFDAPKYQDPNTCTVQQLKSWATAFDIPLPAKPTKAALIKLIKGADPRCQE